MSNIKNKHEPDTECSTDMILKAAQIKLEDARIKVTNLQQQRKDLDEELRLAIQFVDTVKDRVVKAKIIEENNVI